jgi:hypothetical protein
MLTRDIFRAGSDPSTLARAAGVWDSSLLDGGFLPDRPEAGISEQLTPLFGDAEGMVFATDQRLLDKLNDCAGEGLIVASGICPLPPYYNSLMNRGMWNTEEGTRPLPMGAEEAIDFMVSSPPPIMLANLIKAGGISPRTTVLIEETDFYAEWTLDKILNYTKEEITEDKKSELKARLRGFIEVEYSKNTECFERLRRITLGMDTVIGQLITFKDSDPNYADAVAEQVAKWRSMSGGDLLDENGLRAAAFYGMPLVNACLGLGLQEGVVIAEGVSNLVIPDDGIGFNTARIRAFRELATNINRPMIAGFPAPRGSVSLYKGDSLDRMGPADSPGVSGGVVEIPGRLGPKALALLAPGDRYLGEAILAAYFEPENEGFDRLLAQSERNIRYVLTGETL